MIKGAILYSTLNLINQKGLTIKFLTIVRFLLLVFLGYPIFI